MNNLSEDAVRVLRAIHERGLTVNWCYGKPTPVFDDGEKMEWSDWVLLQLECVVTEVVAETRTGLISREMTRIERNSRGTFNNRYVGNGPGQWLLASSTWIAEDTSKAPVVLEERLTETCEPQMYTYTSRHSDYLDDELISSHDTLGRTRRYTLSQAALAVIGEL